MKNYRSNINTKEIAIMIVILMALSYGFRLLKLLDNPKVVTLVMASTITPTPTPALEFATDIHKYIYEVFGEDYDKAMLLLTGNEKCGGENKGLNPRAVNDNRTWGGVGRDRGIFQINDVYHPLTDEQAFDYKQNIDYAYRMYKNDNYTFRRWTAGRCMGI